MKKLFYSIVSIIGLTMFITSCGNSSNNALKGYEWLEGRWVTEDAHLYGHNNKLLDYMYNCIIITEDYCQYTSYNEDNEVITDLKQKPKQSLSIEIENNPFIGDTKIVAGTGYYIDEAKKQLFFIYDFDQKCYMVKK